MKFSKFLKKNICHAILLGFISQLCGTFALAAQQQSPMSWDKQTYTEYKEPQEKVFESLIMELVQQAITNAEDAPSEALLRCYERVLAGNDTLIMEDLVEAMPELVSFALLQYEKDATRSHQENVYDVFNKKYAESKLSNKCLSKCGFHKWMCDLNSIKRNLKKCCKKICIDFKHTWSLIEECCESTQSLIEECCKETQSLIEECCEQTQSNFEHTWSLIEECCEGTQSLINECCKETQSLIEECCEQTQSNFEHTWSLIEECCEGTNSRIEQCCKETQSLIEECCEQTQSNFEHTWSLIEECCEGTNSRIEQCCKETQSLIEECCEQTQSNFEFTWSLIEHLHFDCTLTCDLTEVLTTLSACCAQTQSLIEECCEQTQSNFEHTWSLIEECCEQTHSLIVECCLETHSLIEECCEQTQSNFEFTWSLIEHLNFNCDLTEVLTTLSACCEQTQSNFEFTWSLIEHLNFNCDLTEVLTTLSTDFDITWSKLDVLEECCINNCEKLECIKELLEDTCDVDITLTAPQIITEAGTYCLVNSIDGKITILASNVTLNLNGFTITNQTGDAVLVSNVSNIRIMNGLVSAPNNNGINIQTGVSITLENVDFQGSAVGLNTNIAVMVEVNNCNFYNNQQGLVSLYSNGAVTNCQFVKNAAGLNKSIVEINSSSMTFENTEVSYNTASGNTSAVYISASQDVRWINSGINANSSDGVFAGVKVANSIGTLFQNCEFNFNSSIEDSGVGLWISGCPLTNIQNCFAHDNTGSSSAAIVAGFYLETCENSSLVDSTANNHRNNANNGVGILVGSGVISTNVSRNTVIGNNTGITNNSSNIGTLQNYADASTITNYSGVNPILTLTKATGMFLATDVPPIAPYFNNLANISAI